MPEPKGDLERRVRSLEQAVRSLQEIILGPEDERQREHQQGLAGKVNAVYSDYRDRQAVKRTFWSLVTLLGALNLISAVNLAMQVLR